MQVFTAVIPFEKLFLANSSEQMQVQARLIPSSKSNGKTINRHD